MAIIVKMPKLGLEMDQGIVLEWFFERDESVSEGDVIAEVESEKSIGEVEAREDGVLRRIYLEEGDAIPPGKPIAILAGADEDISALEADVQSELDGEAAVDDGSASEPTAAETETSSGNGQATTTAAASGSSSSASGAIEVKASPRAKQRAEELGVDLTTVEGTGPMDSVTADDVEAAASDSPTESTESVKASPRAKQRAEELGVDLTTVEGTGPMDSVTADDVEAAAETASADAKSGAEIRRISSEAAAGHRFDRTTSVAAPAAGASLLETTEAVRSAFEERVTVTDVVLVVASAALADQPVLNGTYAESTHQLHERQDVALVTEHGDTPSTRVVQGVEEKSLTELVEARESDDGGDDDAGRPSFTLATGTDEAKNSLLVNRPGVAALEIDPSGQRAVPNGERVELEPLVTASLTYDTQAVGAAEADAFLDRFFDRAEDASSLVLDSYRGKE